MICCERCGDSQSFDSNDDLRLHEVATNFGVLVLLCFQCRKEWSRMTYDHDIFREYGETGFRFKMWQQKHRRFPDKYDIEEGVTLLRKLEDYEPILYKLVNNWVKAGPGREERERRPAHESND